MTSKRRRAVSGFYYPHVPPLLPWCAGLIVGILIDDAFRVHLTTSCGIMVVSILLLIAKPRTTAIALLSAMIFAGVTGAMLHAIAQRYIESPHLVRYIGDTPVICRIRGHVAGTPTSRSTVNPYFEKWLYSTQSSSFQVEIEAAEKQGNMCPACGSVWVTVNDAVPDLRRGDTVEIFGEIRRPSSPRNPGQFNWARYAKRHNIHLCMSCDQAENIKTNLRQQSDGVLNTEYWRKAIHHALLGGDVTTGDEATSLLETMILGRRNSINQEIEKRFIDTGCAHYLAVSGLHVGILAGSVWLLSLRVVGLSKRSAAMSVIVLVLAYTALVDPRPSVGRAAIMTVCFGLAALLRRRQQPANTLSLAAIGILVATPASVFDVGFLLSFATVAGLITVYPILSTDGLAVLKHLWLHRPWVPTISEELEALSPSRVKGWRLWVARQIGSLSCVSITAWFCSMPIIAACFGRIAPMGWLNSVITFPLVAMVMMLGFARMAVGLVWQAPAGFFDSLLHGSSIALIQLTEWLSKIPCSTVDVPTPPPPACVAYYCLIIVFVCWRRRIISNGKAITLAAIGLGVGCMWLFHQPSTPGLRITTLAVGRGTSCIIELRNGDTWIYDAGTSGSFDPGQRIILPFLKHRGIDEIEGIILSHQNLDHFGGVPSIVEAVECGPVYISARFNELTAGKSPGGDLIQWLRDHNHPIEIVNCDRKIPFPEPVDAEVLWPPAQLPAGLQANDTSIVIRLTFGKQSVLLTGDIEYAAQQRLIEAGNLSTDVLMLPHHGAVEENTRAFIEAADATHLIRSTFVPNSQSGTLSNLLADRRILNTADMGAIEVTLDGHSVEVRSYAAQQP